jgi:hypothetical protein
MGKAENMNDDVEKILGHRMPRGPAPELRSRVLNAVGLELGRGASSRRLVVAA